MRMMTDDDSLARQAGAGDRAAFQLLLERHYDRVHRLAWRLLGDAGDAEDLAQDICLGLARKLRSYRGDSRFSTWLYRVVVNGARDMIRRRQAARRLKADYAEVSALTRAGDDARRRDTDWLYQTLEALGGDLRETAILVLAEELSHAEAGAVLGIKESTVSWRMHELRKKLKARAQVGEDLPI